MHLSVGLSENIGERLIINSNDKNLERCHIKKLNLEIIILLYGMVA